MIESTAYMSSEPTIDDLVMASVKSLTFDNGTITEKAYAAVDQAGFSAGAASAGFAQRLKKFYDEKLIPALEKSAFQFDELCRTAQAKAGETVNGYAGLLSGEEFSGIETQKLIVVAGTADAIMKLLPSFFEGQLDFSSFTAMDWTLISLGFLMYRDSLKASKAV
jgi:hypothetical protein